MVHPLGSSGFTFTESRPFLEDLSLFCLLFKSTLKLILANSQFIHLEVVINS